VRAVLAVLAALGCATVALRSRRALAREVRPAHPRSPMSGERSRWAARFPGGSHLHARERVQPRARREAL